MKIAYTFRNDRLRQQALTHRSAAPAHNERLEFLGDALLNHLMAEAVFDRFPQASEGQMSRLRAELVRQETLADVARTLGLGESLVLGQGERKSGAWRRDSILSDALEALIAAIYLDSDWPTCRDVVMGWFTGKFAALSVEEEYKDAKTALQEWLQARDRGLPLYELLDESGPDNQRRFSIRCAVRSLDVEGVAEGNSKKQAEQAAASRVLEQLKKRCT